MLTSAHVVAGTGSRVRASFTDGSDLQAIVGADPLSDLAVLRAESTRLQPAELATRPRCGSASSWSRSATRTATRAR